MRIGWDLDGVGYEFVDALRDRIVKTGLRKLEELPKPKVWDFPEDQWGFTTPEWLEIFRLGVDAGEIFRIGPPRPGFVKAFKRARALGHTNHIVTHRAMGQLSVQNTSEWLNEYMRDGNNKPLWDSLTFSADKTIVDTDIFLDDYPVNYDQLDQAGRLVYFLTRPWNKDHPGRRVNSLTEFVKVVEELEHSGLRGDKRVRSVRKGHDRPRTKKPRVAKVGVR